ncbi:loader of DNA helicase [Pectobacterium phage POP12]|nr:loader of DNA helicase [Pectobacterium phage POP12]
MRFKTPFNQETANSRIIPFSVFKLYIVMKAHFSGRYDAIKYNWEMRVTEAIFEKRKDKYFFKKLAERFTFKEIYFILLSNFVANPDFWIGNIDETECVTFYREYIGKLRRVDNIFVDDVKSIYEFSKMKNIPLKMVFEYSKISSTSYISKLVLSDVISYETFLILDSIFDIINTHDQIANDFIWCEFSKKLKAYRRIVDIGTTEKLKYKEKLKQTLIEIKR